MTVCTVYEDGYGNMIPIAPYISQINLDNVDYIEALCSKVYKTQKNTTGVLNNSHLKQESSGFYVLPKNNIKIFIWCPAKLIIKKKQLVATIILCYNLI